MELFILYGFWWSLWTKAVVIHLTSPGGEWEAAPETDLPQKNPTRWQALRIMVETDRNSQSSPFWSCLLMYVIQRHLY